jgi:hypothetical protein
MKPTGTGKKRQNKGEKREERKDMLKTKKKGGKCNKNLKHKKGE